MQKKWRKEGNSVPCEQQQGHYFYHTMVRSSMADVPDF